MTSPSPDPREKFTYRENKDGTFDSICLDCFRTVGTAKRLEDLAEPEAWHKCQPMTLKQPPKKQS